MAVTNAVREYYFSNMPIEPREHFFDNKGLGNYLVDIVSGSHNHIANGLHRLNQVIGIDGHSQISDSFDIDSVAQWNRNLIHGEMALLAVGVGYLVYRNREKIKPVLKEVVDVARNRWDRIKNLTIDRLGDRYDPIFMKYVERTYGKRYTNDRKIRRKLGKFKEKATRLLGECNTSVERRAARDLIVRALDNPYLILNNGKREK